MCGLVLSCRKRSLCRSKMGRMCGEVFHPGSVQLSGWRVQTHAHFRWCRRWLPTPRHALHRNASTWATHCGVRAHVIVHQGVVEGHVTRHWTILAASFPSSTPVHSCTKRTGKHRRRRRRTASTCSLLARKPASQSQFVLTPFSMRPDMRPAVFVAVAVRWSKCRTRM